MNIELNADWPKTKAALEAYLKTVEDFRAEIIDGEPTIDAFFMMLSMQTALKRMNKALGNEYLAKYPGPID